MKFLENAKIIQKPQKNKFGSKKVIILQFIGLKKKLGFFFFFLFKWGPQQNLKRNWDLKPRRKWPRT